MTDHGIIGKHQFIIMKYAGVSVQEILERMKGSHFEISHQVGIQLLNLIEIFHKKGYVHNDIKPDNYCVGEHGKLSLIDYGLSTAYIVDDEHIKPCNRVDLTDNRNFIF